jgi:hypothetical protein
VPRALLDTDTLSHLMRGLRAKQALRQIEIFDERCRASEVLPLTDEAIDRAAQI